MIHNPFDVQGRKYPSPGRCIYCGRRDGLTDEHIVPYCLNGNAQILQASCTECMRITSYLDGYLGRNIFFHMRVHVGAQTRSKFPQALPAVIEREDSAELREFLVPDHPFFLMMPVWHPPRLLEGKDPIYGFGDARSHLYWSIPPNVKEAWGLKDGEIAKVQIPAGSFNLNTFSRALAKIAYCQAIATYKGGGLENIRASAARWLIRGLYPHPSFIVGSVLLDPPPPQPRGTMHHFEFREITRGKISYVVCSFRLFAHSGTADKGMPVYHVVLGTVGKAKVFPERVGPEPPRTIAL